MSAEQIPKAARRVLWSILVVFVVASRLTDMSANWTSDEARWMFRSENFINATLSGNFEDTRPISTKAKASKPGDIKKPSYHPGVTTMWLAGLGLTIQSWQTGDHKHPHNRSTLAYARAPIAAATAVILLLAGHALSRLFGAWTALAVFFFLATDPFYLAECRRVHVDALAASFLLLTVLNWLCHLESARPRTRDVVFAGMAFGLACLSKSPAGLFAVILPLILIGYYRAGKRSASQLVWAAVLWASVSLCTVLLLWPFLWQWRAGPIPAFPIAMAAGIGIAYFASGQLTRSSPSTWRVPPMMIAMAILVLLVGIAGLAVTQIEPVFNRIGSAIVAMHGKPHLFLGTIYGPRDEPIDATFTFLYYPVYWFYWSGPLTALLVGVAMWRATVERRERPELWRVSLALLLTGALLIVSITPVAKKLYRYLVLGLPLWDVVAGIGFVALVGLVAKRMPWRFAPHALAVLLLLVHVGPVLAMHPYYRAYHHPALPKSWVVENISLGGGNGLDLAADYLNAKPRARTLKVGITRVGRLLRHTFKGMTQAKRVVNPDYYVVYIRDHQIDQPLETRYMKRLEKVITLNGIDYVWIYASK